jgi:hypothetical protein
LLPAGIVVAIVAIVAAVAVTVYASRSSDSDADTTPTALDLALTGIAQGTRTPSVAIRTALAIEESATPRPAELSDWQRAEQDDSSDIAGTFYPSQGRGHFPGGLAGHVMTPFCGGIAHAESAPQTITPTSAMSGVRGEGAFTCYTSNPPSSGEHLNVQRNVDLGNGLTINIPADPDVYPDEIEIPRDSIPHILEHAGVFIGWNCAMGDETCIETVQHLKQLVNERIDHKDERIVLAHDSDLTAGTIALASWTRVESFGYGDYSDGRVTRFTSANSCRFDPEGFCR